MLQARRRYPASIVTYRPAALQNRVTDGSTGSGNQPPARSKVVPSSSNNLHRLQLAFNAQAGIHTVTEADVFAALRPNLTLRAQQAYCYDPAVSLRGPLLYTAPLDDPCLHCDLINPACRHRPQLLDPEPHNPLCRSFDHSELHLPTVDTSPANTGKRDDAVPWDSPHAMEGPTILATQSAATTTTTSLLASPTQRALTDMPELDADEPAHTPAKETVGQQDHVNSSWPDTPAHVTDHGLLSNIRGASSQNADPVLAAPTESADVAASVPSIDNDVPTKTEPQTNASIFDYEEPATPSLEQPTPAEESPEDAFNEHEAYAMLRFPDSYALITSLNFVITRDESYMRRWRQQEKERRRRLKAHQALLSYAKEPSHKSEDGLDQDPSSKSGDGEQLEGRPARGLLSNYSEQGGPVAYAPSDDEELDEYEASRARRRSRKNNNSSTSNSIAPADLHLFQSGTFDAGEQMGVNNYVKDGAESDPHEWAALPVHTANPEDITRISREHLIFSYDSASERWVLHVVGNGAVVNGVQYPKGTRDIELHHDDEIFISTVAMRFALPAGLQASADDDENNNAESILESVEGASDFGSSPVHRLSRAYGVDDSEDEDEDGLTSHREKTKIPKKPVTLKLKLKNSKKAGPKDEAAKGKGKAQGLQKDQNKSGGKANRKDKSDEDDDVKESGKKSEKGKKPKSSAPDAASAQKLGPEKTEATTASENGQQPKPTQASPPAVPLNLDPGSVLAGLEPEQMPEKRKGPGRPPKNGLLSKRDESGIKRKRKEYERSGLEIPDLNILLQEVRAEQRQKDAMNKALARGEPAPEMVVPSIEAGSSAEGQRAPSSASKERYGELSMHGERGPSSPKPARRIKSPSPIPPESSFTEEDLKKPNMTYIYIINEILESIEGGQADLQTIYDKIQKKWPYFKYRVSSVGWQSSVRHNLLSCDRFKDAGKSGKGKMWTINTDHPLDNKKRKPTPPPRPPQMSMPNGQMPYQYGQNAYPQYGQQQYNPHGPYASPYGGGHAPPNGHFQTAGAPRQSSHQPPQQAPNPFGNIVTAILAFRERWVMTYQRDPVEFKRREDLFNQGTNYFSNVYHKQGETPTAEVNVEEEPFRSLKAIFEQHNDVFSKKSSSESANLQGTSSGSSSNPGGSTGVQPHSAASLAVPGSTTGQNVGSLQQGSNHGGQLTGLVAPSSSGYAVAASQMVPPSHGHGSVQQQIGNAVANQAPHAAPPQQAASLANGHMAHPQSFVSQPPSAPSLPTQPSQPTIQQHSLPTHSPTQRTSQAFSGAPYGTNVAAYGNNQTPLAPPTPAVPAALPSTADASSHAHPTAPTLPLTTMDGTASPTAPAYSTPKAPTPEALSRPPSAGAGVKRAAEDETASPAADDLEAKRQRTS